MSSSPSSSNSPSTIKQTTFTIRNEYKFLLPFANNDIQTNILISFIKDISHSFTLQFDDFLDRGHKDTFVQLFHEFLGLEQNVMALDFIFNLDNFKLVKSTRNRFKMGKQIVENYVSDNSANQLNLPNLVKENLLREFAKCSIKEMPLTIFDPIFKHIHYSLKTDNFMRFVGSDLYAKFILDQMGKEFKSYSNVSIEQICEFLERCFKQHLGCKKVTDNLFLSEKLVHFIQVSNNSGNDVEEHNFVCSPCLNRIQSPFSEDTASSPSEYEMDFKSFNYTIPTYSKIHKVLESVISDESGIVQDKHYTLFKMLHQDQGIWQKSRVMGETTSYYTELSLNIDSKRKQKFKIFKETGIVKASTEEAIHIMFDSYFSKRSAEEKTHIDYIQGEIYSCIVSQLCVKKSFPLSSRVFLVGLSARDETLHEWHTGQENKNEETFRLICNSKQSNYWIARLPIHNTTIPTPKGHVKGSLFGGSYIERISDTESRYSMMVYCDVNSFLPVSMWKSNNNNSKTDLISSFNELVRERRNQTLEKLTNQTINTINDYRKNIGKIYGFSL